MTAKSRAGLQFDSTIESEDKTDIVDATPSPSSLCPPRPILVRTRLEAINQPLEEIAEFEQAIVEQGGWDVVSGLGKVWPLKVTARLVYWLSTALQPLLHAIPANWKHRDYFSVGYVARHYLIYKTFPYFTIPGGRRMVWLYDSWENQLEEMAATFRTQRINLAFVSSRQAADHFNTLGLDDFHACWVPEAVTVANHRFKPWRQRTTDILQLGRRWDDYHFEIEPQCRAAGLVYLFEKVKGELIFPTREGFLDGLADAKISICVPSSITHPARSGKIETMTWRYLQSMASKCLILGRCPEEMKELFGYNPLIEIDLARPGEQLREILESYEDYLPLIERNYACVSAHHQWPNRLATIEDAIGEFKTRPSSLTRTPP